MLCITRPRAFAGGGSTGVRKSTQEKLRQVLRAAVAIELLDRRPGSCKRAHGRFGVLCVGELGRLLIPFAALVTAP